MISLPEKYKWLKDETAPKMIVEFVNIFGIEEVAGSGDNPIILQWAKEVGVEKDYNHDSIAWCGLEMAVICKRADKPVIKNPLWARNWLAWGVPVSTPMLGDILVFWREEGGHVGLYIAEDDDCYHVGGGNESNASNIVRIDKKRLLGARRPQWKVSQPSNVRRIFMNKDGIISKNES